MKKMIVIVAVVIVAIITGIIVLGGGKDSKSDGANAPSSSGSAADKQSSNATSDIATPVTKDGTETVTIKADDTSASPNIINVHQGDKIIITFDVQQQGTYHGGLTFKSTDPPIESDPIAAGSTGDVTFTATKSFQFTPYWYESDVQKDYTVSVNVQ